MKKTMLMWERIDEDSVNQLNKQVHVVLQRARLPHGWLVRSIHDQYDRTQARGVPVDIEANPASRRRSFRWVRHCGTDGWVLPELATGALIAGGVLDVWSADKLVLFIAFVVPGFVSLKTYELLSSGLSKDAATQVVDAVAYSSVNYALLLWPIYEVESANLSANSSTAYVLFYVFVLLIAPILWAAALRKIRESQFFQRALPHPTGKPWDYVFSQRKPYWIIVTLKDGKKIAGRFDSHSFASSAPSPEQIYLEETWVLNDAGGFERPRIGSAGVLIFSAEIASVEFFNLTRGGANAERTEEPD